MTAGCVRVSHPTAVREHEIRVFPDAPHAVSPTHDEAVNAGRSEADALGVDAWLTEDHTHVVKIASHRPSDDHGARTHGLVYRGPGRRAWEERARPVVQDQTDAIVRITTSTICGTDLHILKGDVPSVAGGRHLGDQGSGVVSAR